jgi:hypothetical protein
MLGLDGVGSLSVVALGGDNGQSHFFAHCAGQEAANRMRQPAGGFHQFFRSRAARPFQQVEDFGSLAAITCNFGLGNLDLAASFGRFLGGFGPAGLLSLGARNVGVT